MSREQRYCATGAQLVAAQKRPISTAGAQSLAAPAAANGSRLTAPSDC